MTESIEENKPQHIYRILALLKIKESIKEYDIKCITLKDIERLPGFLGMISETAEGVFRDLFDEGIIKTWDEQPIMYKVVKPEKLDNTIFKISRKDAVEQLIERLLGNLIEDFTKENYEWAEGVIANGLTGFNEISNDVLKTTYWNTFNDSIRDDGCDDIEIT